MSLTQIAPDLWATPHYPVQDIASANTRAYLLTRPQGNVLIYGLGFQREEADEDVLDEIAALGGVQLQLLSHGDEASHSLEAVRERFGSRLACSAVEVDQIDNYAEGLSIDLAWEPDCADETLDGLEIMATPGHTRGSISVRYESPHGQTYLFTGDTIVPKDDGGWATAVAEQQGGTAADLERSLLALRTQSFDLLASSAYVGETSTASPSPEEWQAIVDHRLERLREWAAARA